MHEDCHNPKKHGLVFTTLFVFGLAYNALVDWMEKRGYESRMTWALVGAGVAATIALPYIMFGWRKWSAGELFISFLCSGIPMIAGDIRRDEKEAEQIRSDLLLTVDTGRMQDNERSEPTAPPPLTTKSRRGHLE